MGSHNGLLGLQGPTHLQMTVEDVGTLTLQNRFQGPWQARHCTQTIFKRPWSTKAQRPSQAFLVRRILVCGGRDFGITPQDLQLLDAVLTKHCQPGDVIINGGAKGADSAAGTWALQHGYAVEAYPVDYALDGKWPGAGPRRNARMYASSHPDLVIAFPGGKGTASMCRIARHGGTPVVEVEEPFAYT